MDNKLKRKIIIAIIILIIAIVGVLVLMKIVNNNSKSDIIEYEPIIVVDSELKGTTSRGYYYVVKNIVEKYYYSLCGLNDTVDDILIFEDDEENNNIEKELNKEKELTKKKIYNYFDEAYIDKMGLSVDNIQEKLGNYDDLNVLIKKMYTRDISEYLKLYFVFGTIIENEKLTTQDFNMMIILDNKNYTFNIYTSDYIEANNIYEQIQKKDFEMDITEIENRKYNKFKYQYINDETYASDLMEHYINTIKYLETAYSYNRLDKEYRENRFGSEAEYKEYIEENNNRLRTSLLDYYKVDKYDDYTQYTCMDRKGNYYIFKESAVMDYSLFLDIYTIDLPEFVEKYNNATTEDKVKLNIEKIVEALNQKDYKYLYNKLVKEFKNNNFKNYEEFEEYAENTFDIENEVTYNKYTESENYCTYKITLKGKDKTITKTIVMKLEKGTDFVISFNIE